jgi:hypothetical protein
MTQPLVTLANRRSGLDRLSVFVGGEGVERGDDGLPVAVRLFKRGWNDTEKGQFLFDDEAAKMVMAASGAHGVDRVIDLEHLSLEDQPANENAYDARGWFQLEVRSGELWAVNVKWTPDGAARLTEKRQRYISPAFATDDEGRITKVVNMALTAMPATHHTPALVAAGTRTKGMNPEQLKRLLKLRADGVSDNDILTELAIDIKTLQSVVKAMGGDPGAPLGDLMGMVGAFAKELADMAAGKAPEAEEEPVAMADPAAVVAEEDPKLSARRQVEALRLELQTLREKDQAELNILKAEKKSRDDETRRGLVASLVVLGRETPATAWVNSDGKTPRGSLATMPLEELAARVKEFGGAPMPPNAVNPPTGSVTITSGIETSDHEIIRLKRACAKTKVDFDAALDRYNEIRDQQLTKASEKGDRRRCQMISRKLEESDVLLNAHGRLTYDNLKTLSTAVTPYSEFGAASQRALEEFRLEHNTALASQPVVWAETYGNLLPGGSLKDTYPINFSANAYKKKIAQNAPAHTSQTKEVSVVKDLYHDAQEVELMRLVKGDFAYIKAWGENAARMARARVFLRNQLVATLLEANGTWDPDGIAFFSASHKVNPFDSAQLFRAAATWSNLQTATPLDNGALTAEKNLFLYSTPGPDGNELGHEASVILHPTYLNETAKNLLTVQDIILQAGATVDGVSNVMGATKNPHYMSGMSQTRAPELTGTASTADWYLLSQQAIAAGLAPWVLAEDAGEEIREWDENSDFYKNTGFIKYESLIMIAAALLYPHGIRKVEGT